MATIFDLGEDVFIHICEYLSLNDILNLSLTCSKLHIWLTCNELFHHLYIRKFGKLTPLEAGLYQWKQLFQLRNSKKLQFYTWGTGELGRLGYSLRDIPQSSCASRAFGVHTPTMVPNFEKSVIEQVSCGGFSFQLRVNGRIYSIGLGYTDNTGRLARPGPREADYQPPIHNTMSLSSFTDRNLFRGLHATPSAQMSSSHHNEFERWDQTVKKGPFLTQLMLPNTESDQEPFVCEISSGRMHVLALDNMGSVYTWDCGNSESNLGVRIRFPGLKTRVTKIFAGWDISVCHIQDVGLVYWQYRGSINRAEFEAKNFESDAEYSFVPGLVNVVDFVALCDHIIFIELNGRLSAFKTAEGRNAAPPEPLNEFNCWIENYNKENAKETEFKKLSGCFKSFSVFTNNGLVLLGNIEGEVIQWQPKIITKLQNAGVIDIVSGDYHQLALTDEGELLSWGLELQKKGCLGLGDLSTSTNEVIIDEGSSFRVLEPTRVLKPTSNGKWFAVTAGGWHSGGLFISDGN